MGYLTVKQTESRDKFIAECVAKGIVLDDEKIRFINAMIASFEK